MVSSFGTTLPPGTAWPLVVSTTRSSAVRPSVITRSPPTRSCPVLMRFCSTTLSLLTTSAYLPAWSSATTRLGISRTDVEPRPSGTLMRVKKPGIRARSGFLNRPRTRMVPVCASISGAT